MKHFLYLKELPMKKSIFLFLLINFNLVFADQLAKNSNEYKHLELMGYQISPSDISDPLTYVELKDVSVALNKKKDVLNIFIFINIEENINSIEKKLNKLSNLINKYTSFQSYIDEDTKQLVLSISVKGDYNSKNFSTAIRECESWLETMGNHPEIVTLMKEILF